MTRGAFPARGEGWDHHTVYDRQPGVSDSASTCLQSAWIPRPPHPPPQKKKKKKKLTFTCHQLTNSGMIWWCKQKHVDQNWSTYSASFVGIGHKPFKILGTQLSWIKVGLFRPKALHWSANQSCKPSELKEFFTLSSPMSAILVSSVNSFPPAGKDLLSSSSSSAPARY